MRILTLLLAGVLALLAMPAATLAAAPANDTPATATVVSSLPFSETVDLATATDTDGDGLPACEASARHRIWYSYTPASDEVLRVSAGGDFGVEIATWTNPSSPVLIGCAVAGSAETRRLTSGVTYLVSVGMWTFDPPYAGEVRFERIEPAANDDFANAEVIAAFPFRTDVTDEVTTAEPHEPFPCGWGDSRWYRFTPDDDVAVVPRTTEGSVAVFQGTTLLDLQFVGCGGPWSGPAVIAPAGVTTWFQVLGPGPFTFRLDEPGAPIVDFGYGPGDPSSLDEVHFHSFSWDPAGLGIVSYAWDFGDGTTATGGFVQHRYPVDGTYDVVHTVTTPDGRSASTTRQVVVATHDVAIARLSVPKTASAGQRRDVVVALANRRRAETVEVVLYRVAAAGAAEIGRQRVALPVTSGSRTVNITFSYVFTAEDASLGKTTFRAVLAIDGARDALPGDNEAIATTRVTR